MMTNEQIRRTIDALVETNRVIAHEESYRIDLQNNVLLTQYREHKAKLCAMLAPEFARLLTAKA